MSLLGKILGYTPVGILADSVKSGIQGEKPKAWTITEPARNQFLSQYGLSGAKQVADGSKNVSTQDVFGLLSGTNRKPTNPTVNPGTNAASPTTKTPGVSENVLFDDYSTNTGLNPLWLLAALVAVLLIGGRKLFTLGR